MVTCDYCETDKLVYELSLGRGGPVHRCIECLAIEQIQRQVNLPFEVWIERNNAEPLECLDAPDIDSSDPREHDYEVVRAWARVLARIRDNDPIVKREPDAIGTIFDDTREFLTNVMGEDAHKRPSELQDGA